jgi:hypothetical protein
MAIIRLRARLPDDSDPYAFPDLVPKAGTFDTNAASYWPAGSPDDTTRVWLTASGKWVMTARDWDCYITPIEAREWLTANGHRDAAVEHIDKQYDGPGRPEIGPEVKFRVPQEVRDRIDALATVNGVTRAEQLRTIVMDSLYAA